MDLRPLAWLMNNIPAREGRSRPSIERIIRLARLIRHGLSFTAAEIAGEFETSRKTVVRDIAFMRERLGWSFEYDPSARKYRFISAPTGPVL